MNKDTILCIAPHVLKRMEYGNETFYLLNFENDEIWTGNYTSYLIVDRLDGHTKINDIVDSLVNEIKDFSYDDLYNATIEIFQELFEKKFIIISVE